MVVSLVIPLNFLDHSFLSGIFHQHLQNEVVGSISMWNRSDCHFFLRYYPFPSTLVVLKSVLRVFICEKYDFSFISKINL